MKTNFAENGVKTLDDFFWVRDIRLLPQPADNILDSLLLLLLPYVFLIIGHAK